MARWLAFAMIIVAVGLVVWTLRPQSQAPTIRTDVSPDPIERPPSTGPAVAVPTPGSATESKGVVLLIPASDPEDSGSVGEHLPVRLPLAAKLAGQPLSQVEHQLVGAWDDDPKSVDPGAHRTFVAVVDPNLPTRELETLVRDIADRNRSAQVLDIRVYDSIEAAQMPPTADGGKARLQHLVAQIVRNERLDYEQITVRGQSIDP